VYVSWLNRIAEFTAGIEYFFVMDGTRLGNSLYSKLLQEMVYIVLITIDHYRIILVFA